MQEQQKVVATVGIKASVIISIVIVVLAVIIGPAMIAAAVGAFTSDAILAPFRLIAHVPLPITVIVIAAAAACITITIRQHRYWYMMPLGAAIIAVGWLASCRIVVNLIHSASR